MCLFVCTCVRVTSMLQCLWLVYLVVNFYMRLWGSEYGVAASLSYWELNLKNTPVNICNHIQTSEIAWWLETTELNSNVKRDRKTQRFNKSIINQQHSTSHKPCGYMKFGLDWHLSDSLISFVSPVILLSDLLGDIT